MRYGYLVAMLFFGAGVSAALIELECPYCGTVQRRTRRPDQQFYVCRQCRRHFEPPEPQPGRTARTPRTGKKR